THWKNNKRFPIIVRLVLMLLLMSIVWVLSTRLIDISIDIDFGNSIGQHLNQQQQDYINKLIPLLMLLLVIVYVIGQYVKRFGELGWVYRGTGICFIFVMILMFCSVLNNIFFNQMFISESIKFLLKITAFGFLIF